MLEEVSSTVLGGEISQAECIVLSLPARWDLIPWCVHSYQNRRYMFDIVMSYWCDCSGNQLQWGLWAEAFVSVLSETQAETVRVKYQLYIVAGFDDILCLFNPSSYIPHSEQSQGQRMEEYQGGLQCYYWTRISFTNQLRSFGISWLLTLQKTVERCSRFAWWLMQLSSIQSLTCTML